MGCSRAASRNDCMRALMSRWNDSVLRDLLGFSATPWPLSGVRGSGSAPRGSWFPAATLARPRTKREAYGASRFVRGRARVAAGNQLPRGTEPDPRTPERGHGVAEKPSKSRSTESFQRDISARMQSFLEAARLQPIFDAQQKILTEVVSRLQPGDVLAKVHAVFEAQQ